jgi:heptosyltransferase II
MSKSHSLGLVLQLTSAGTPKRILVSEVNWLGDAVMSLPALRAIRRAWPNAHLVVLIRRELAGLFDGAQWIDSLILYTYANGRLDVTEFARTILKIRRERFDLAVLFPNNFRSALWVALAGVPARAGYIRNRRGALLTHRSPTQERTGTHQSQHWLEMIRSTLGIEYEAEKAALEVAESHRERMREWLLLNRRSVKSQMIAIAPCAAFGPAKEWPPGSYTELISLLAKRGVECVLVGTRSERAKCENIAKSAGGAVLATGETSVGELTALLSICDGFVGNDSGCAHVAAALGIPTVAIFGSTDSSRTAPMGPRVAVVRQTIDCSPCFARTCRFDHYDCMRSIAPREVIETLERLCMSEVCDREPTT